jgi:glycerol-3-phosphate acyltransferase PlsY
LLIFSYLIGSLPTALWFGLFLRGIDIRLHGSGNAGATNAIRVLGWPAGLLVLLIDFLKGALPTLLLPLYAAPASWQDYFPLCIGSATILGHIYPLWAGFRGGKGVGTAAGVFAVLIPLSLLSGLLAFSLVFWRSKIVSLGSVVAALVALISMPLYDFWHWQDANWLSEAVVAGICVLIIFRHRGNLKRLWLGQEKRINWEKEQ